MTRIRKAYTYLSYTQEIGPDTIYAPTAGAARSDIFFALMDSWGLRFGDCLKLDIEIRRNPLHDVTLPDRHPLAAELPAEDLHIITHAFGGTGPNAGYRDHFFTAATDPKLMRLAAIGLFDRGASLDSRSYPNGSAYFTLTDLGRAVAAGEQRLYDLDIEIRHAERLKRKAARRQAEAA